MNMKYLFKIDQLPTQILILISLVGAFVFYGRDYVIIEVDPKSTLGFCTYIIWLLGCVLLIIKFLNYFIIKIKEYYYTKKAEKQYRETLEGLNDDERLVIREFTLFDRLAMDLPFDHPVITSLMRKEVIYRFSSLGSSFIVKPGGDTT